MSNLLIFLIKLLFLIGVMGFCAVVMLDCGFSSDEYRNALLFMIALLTGMKYLDKE